MCSLARFIVLGAFVFVMLTASATSFAQEQKAGAPSSASANESTPLPSNGIKRPYAINVKPFEDFALMGKKLIDEGKLDLKNRTIEATATAELNDDDTLNPETVKIWVSAQDEIILTLAQQLVTVISQSRILGILNEAKDVRMALKLDQTNASIKVISELPSEDKAMMTATGWNMVIDFARRSKKDTQEGELYNSLKFSSDGKQFAMSFEMPKEALGKMISDMLAKKAAKAAAAAQDKK